MEKCDSFDENSSSSSGSFSISRKSNRKYSILGYVFAMLGALFSAIAYVMNKLYDGDKGQLVVIRAVVQLIFVIPLINLRKIDVIGPTRRTTAVLLLRGFISGCTVLTINLAFNYLPVGDVTAIYYAFPAMVGILARIYLKEHCGFLRVIVTMVTFVGLIFVAQPSFIFGFGSSTNAIISTSSSTKWLGLCLAFASATFCAIDCIIIRKIGSKVHFGALVLYLSVESLIMSLAYLAVLNQFKIPCQNDFPLLICAAFLLCINQVFIVCALQLVEAGPVGLILALEIVFSYIFQYIIFHSLPNLFGGIGASMIFCCTVITSLQAVLKCKVK